MTPLPTTTFGWVGIAVMTGSLVTIAALEVRKTRARRRHVRERDEAIRRARAISRRAYDGPRRRRSDWDPTVRRPWEDGQTLVEFALVCVIAIPLFLLGTQVIALLAYSVEQTHATGTLVDVLAADGVGAYHRALHDEIDRLRCGHPRDNAESADGVIVLTLTCTWTAPLDESAHWPVTTTSSARDPGPSPEPSPSMSPEPSDTPAPSGSPSMAGVR